MSARDLTLENLSLKNLERHYKFVAKSLVNVLIRQNKLGDEFNPEKISDIQDFFQDIYDGINDVNDLLKRVAGTDIEKKLRVLSSKYEDLDLVGGRILVIPEVKTGDDLIARGWKVFSKELQSDGTYLVTYMLFGEIQENPVGIEKTAISSYGTCIIKLVEPCYV